MSHIACTLAAIWLGLAAPASGAHAVGLTAYQNQPFTPHSVTDTSTLYTYTATSSTSTVAPTPEPEPEPETSTSIATVTDFTAGVLSPDVLVADASARLVIRGGDPELPMLVDATPKTFADWDAFFEFVEHRLGATLVRDDAGMVFAATGQYVLSGDVVFDDAGEEFESLDYVASVLGGLGGAIEIDGEIHSLFAPNANPDGTVSYLSQTASDCSPDGESCIEGHSWLTHALIYHSVGARTRQTSGGVETVTRWACTSGELVTFQGTRQCRYRNPGAWEWDADARALVPTSAGADEDLYFYGPLVPIDHEALQNQLRVGARVFAGPNAPANLEPVVVTNERKAELGNWTIIRDVLPEEFGNTVPIRDITGICASHSGSRGEFVRSADGSTGDDDILCAGGVPY